MAELQTQKEKETQKEPEVEEHNSCTSQSAGISSKGHTTTDATGIQIKVNNEYANLIPELTKEEYGSLKNSIKESGLWVPLIVNQDGVLLDGHHRYKACQELGVKPYYKVKEFNDQFSEKLFVIDCNLKRRQLNDFERVKLALKSKSIKEEIARKNSQSNLKQNSISPPSSPPLPSYRPSPTVRNLTVETSNGTGINAAGGSGRVDDQIGEMAGVSRDTVRRVEKILQYVQEGGEIMQKLRTGEMTINQAYKSICKDERIKKQQQAESATTQSVISNKIVENATSNTTTATSTAKGSSHSLGTKENAYESIQSTEKSSEQGEDLAMENYQLKQENQDLRERIKYLEQINPQQQQEEEWSQTGFIDIVHLRNVPIKVTVNTARREVVYMEVDVDYIKGKKRVNREQQLQKQQKEI